MSKQKNTRYFQNKEIFSRMNFLYQAATLMVGRNNKLAAYYGQLCRCIGQKGVAKMEPDMKRSLCKNCAIPQRLGVTAELSVDPPAKPGKRKRKLAAGMVCMDEGAKLQVSCQICLHRRSFRINSAYYSWVDDPASIVETIKGNEKIMHDPIDSSNISKTEKKPSKQRKQYVDQKLSCVVENDEKSVKKSSNALENPNNENCVQSLTSAMDVETETITQLKS